MIWDNPPHRTTLASLTTGVDAGYGVSNSFSTAQASVPCLINTSAASEVELYAQQNIRVTHCVAYKASALGVTMTPGMKITADDTGDAYRVHGIRKGRAAFGLPAFVYADVEQLL